MRAEVNEFELSSDQRDAVELMLNVDNKVASVTGGAGTGKTTILKRVYDDIRTNHRRAILAAPTGRAAKRIQEATGIEARTIHRLLEFPAPFEVDESKGKLKFGEPKRNHYNPLPCDYLLLDEASMINSRLWRQVIDAMPRGSYIRLFGDTNQLPPIDEELPNGASVFKRALDDYPAAYLPHNFRSDDGLIESANRILRGSIPTRSEKFEIVCTNDPLKALKHYATDEFHSTDHQVLTPKKKGVVGSTKLSSFLRTQFNLTTKNQSIILERLYDDDPITVFEGDKIIWTKNDYVLNIMNGELGMVDEISDGSLHITFDDNRHVIIPPNVKGPFGNFYDPRKQIDLAYCMTTHKAQGSEFQSIIYFMTRAQAFMLNRNNFYTGVTRAKHRVIVICDPHALKYSMRKPRA